MTCRRRSLAALLLLWVIAAPPAGALFNLNQGKDLIFVNATYSIGLDTNVFTRQAGKSSPTQSASASIDYTRQAGLIAVAASASVSVGNFTAISGQDFTDPSLSLSFRKRYGRTTGSMSFSGRHDSQPDPDAGQRTKSWNYGSSIDIRYPVNDRYYLTNGFSYNGKFYADKVQFSDLGSYGDSIFVNYIYTSKLDLNGGYSIRVSNTSRDTKAYDHSLTLGASGGILPKLSGSIHFGYQIRQSNSVIGGHENFSAFTSSTNLKWLFSRKISFSGEISEDFSTTSTDISTNKLSLGLHMTASITSKLIGNFGVTYSGTNFLGIAGDGRHDDMFMFDASTGLALTTHIRTSISYAYMINVSNRSIYNFERQTLTFTIAASY
jgi:hypothetical protein